MVHLLAQLVGTKLETVGLNGSTDTMELLEGLRAGMDRRSVAEVGGVGQG